MKPQTVPQTHVLIIGIGEYPYASGGSKYKTGANSMLDNLVQLSSPIVSATAFHAKIIEIENANRWRNPLGHVRMLHSGALKKTDRPTREAIKNAFKKWREACDQHEDNIAIFFFSGHGVEKHDHYLLAEDFGKDPDNVWEGSFDFDSTRQSFFDCKAKTQCFFVDACRTLTTEMLTSKINSLALQPPSELSTDCEHNLTIKATAKNEEAHANLNEPSFFTKAIILAIERYGYEKINGEWVIRTNQLSANMDDYIRLVSEGIRQRCTNVSNRSSILIKSTTAPIVEVTIACDPDKRLTKPIWNVFIQTPDLELIGRLPNNLGRLKLAPASINFQQILPVHHSRMQANIPT